MAAKTFVWLLIHNTNEISAVKKMIAVQKNVSYGILFSDYHTFKSFIPLTSGKSKRKIPFGFQLKKNDSTDIPENYQKFPLLKRKNNSELAAKNTVYRFVISSGNSNPFLDELVEEIMLYHWFADNKPEMQIVAQLSSRLLQKNNNIIDILFYMGVNEFIIPFNKCNVEILLSKFSGDAGESKESVKDSSEISQLRLKIDELDNIIITTIKERLMVVKTLGELKGLLNQKIYHDKRWKEILNTRCTLAKKLKVDQFFIESIFTAIHLQGLKIILKNKYR